ncbi:hypothetical protein IO44_11155 [Gallibacterium anatis str. Avicor]|uniref:hypothetical protein n=1 Tax=Gallibacterium anatis TaxID=750 RepID=UPI000531BC53|nr:hypothetical protein [Gallibacterium anatis]KGQ53422.1 hypothetical protein IO44_11155 [Gallibacterium anatis str. Avicor]
MNNVESYKFNPTNQNILNKQRELWGLPTKKAPLLELFNITKVPYSAICSLLNYDPEKLRQQVEGKLECERKDDLIHFHIYLILNKGYEFGLLPCKDENILIKLLQFIYKLEIKKEYIIDDIADNKLYDIIKIQDTFTLLKTDSKNNIDLVVKLKQKIEQSLNMIKHEILLIKNTENENNNKENKFIKFIKNFIINNNEQQNYVQLENKINQAIENNQQLSEAIESIKYFPHNIEQLETNYIPYIAANIEMLISDLNDEIATKEMEILELNRKLRKSASEKIEKKYKLHPVMQESFQQLLAQKEKEIERLTNQLEQYQKHHDKNSENTDFVISERLKQAFEQKDQQINQLQQELKTARALLASYLNNFERWLDLYKQNQDIFKQE